MAQKVYLRVDHFQLYYLKSTCRNLKKVIMNTKNQCLKTIVFYIRYVVDMILMFRHKMVSTIDDKPLEPGPSLYKI